MNLSDQQSRPTVLVSRGWSRWSLGVAFLTGVAVGVGAFAIVDYYLGQTAAAVARTTAGVVDRFAGLTFESRAEPAGSIVTESGQTIANIIATLTVQRFPDSGQRDSVYFATFVSHFTNRIGRSDSAYAGFVQTTRPLVIDLRRLLTLPARRPRGYLVIPGGEAVPVF
jgi:hypothetical protein